MKKKALKKTQEKQSKYCSDPLELIENFKAAEAEGFKGWCIHHRLEIWPDGTKMSVQELKSKGLYWHRPAEELIYMREEDHAKIHLTGKRASVETRQKMQAAKSGKKHTTQHKRAISQQIREFYASGKQHMLVKATRGSETLLFPNASAFARFAGVSKQAVSFVLSPKHPQFKTAAGWKLERVPPSKLVSALDSMLSGILEEAFA